MCPGCRRQLTIPSVLWLVLCFFIVKNFYSNQTGSLYLEYLVLFEYCVVPTCFCASKDRSGINHCMKSVNVTNYNKCTELVSFRDMVNSIMANFVLKSPKSALLIHNMRSLRGVFPSIIKSPFNFFPFIDHLKKEHE